MMRRPLGLLVASVVGLGGVAYLEKTSDSTTWWSSLSGVRFARAGLTALSVAIDYKMTLSRSTENYQMTKSKLHVRSAQRLIKMCRKNGGCYIKIGQHVGAMEYVFPEEYTSAFKIFHSDAPSTEIDKVRAVIQGELNEPVSEYFTHIDPEPLGAASLAQCHKGTLKDGRVVALKVQHPTVEKNGFIDMATVDFLVYCASKVFPDFKFQWLVDEVRKNLPQELDFRIEAGNIEKCSSLLSHLDFVKIPEVYKATKKLLVMEFCEGGKINDLRYINKNNLSVNQISLRVAEMYSQMIYRFGFIHCDPHPGNVLVKKRQDKGDVQLILLDHGLYQQLSEEFRITYCRLWDGLMKSDMEAIKTHCLALNAGELYPLLACVVTARSWESIQRGIGNESRSINEINAIGTDVARYFSEITHLLNTVPRQLLLILKTNDLLRSLDHALKSSCHTHSFITMSKHCIKAIGHEDEKWAGSKRELIVLRMKTKWQLFKLYLFEWWVWLIPPLNQ